MLGVHKNTSFCPALCLPGVCTAVDGDGAADRLLAGTCSDFLEEFRRVCVAVAAEVCFKVGLSVCFINPLNKLLELVNDSDEN